ncbi:thioredoxin family protein [Fusobacterium pseudoperiodonticum]|uniref:thioredoxin family protein n=1 Tax=Fusobacterium pseudoperiodonticum TaxID=2663009 RepID=UPI000C1C1FBB|nr:thioredoxin family protein [Fusobacterium pseudoperiodonticum]ATV57096.1 thiol reductase thioredoxin [Fusobacterium pseudoperiodonticum]ATV68323.1 thioredoxin [Fusobacterium pseudoperiodonticum]
MEKIKTYDELLEKIKNEEKFLLYIKSEGCSVCEADFPKIKELVDKNNYLAYYIQADEISEAVGQLNLYTAPVVILFYNGKEIHRQARFIDFLELDYRIKQTL